jgi:uncharacterized protein YqjF (DUF2071 family)
MRQSWRDLLFAHYRVDPAEVRTSLPVDTFDGSAWLTVTPHRIEGIRLRGFPQLPGASSMLEVSVRTYVTLSGRPAVLFLRLDTNRRLASFAARRLFRADYRVGRLVLQRDGDALRFESLDYTVRYRPSGDEFRAEPGTLDHFLTERYAMAIDHPRLYRCDFEYEPWRLRPAEVQFEVDRLGGGDAPELARFSEVQHVRFGAPTLA